LSVALPRRLDTSCGADRPSTSYGRSPGDRISCVQINDGLATVPAHRSRFQDCLEDRMMPGTGAFPIAAILQTLKDGGGLRRVGPELFSSRLDAMTAEEIGRTCRDAQDTALALIA
jgi:hypothetical protein